VREPSPIGAIPRWAADSQRAQDLADAISRFAAADLKKHAKVIDVWVQELYDISTRYALDAEIAEGESGTLKLGEVRSRMLELDWWNTGEALLEGGYVVHILGPLNAERPHVSRSVIASETSTLSYDDALVKAFEKAVANRAGPLSRLSKSGAEFAKRYKSL
jgi:5-carboxymethyl-2-hydroxymuconate isomerase